MAGELQKLYVGCGLTHASEAFKQSVEDLKGVLRSEFDFELFDFMGTEKGTPLDVYEWDIEHCVETCDAFLSIHDVVSEGLGQELAHAGMRGIPMLGVCHRDFKLTRLTIGRAEKFPNFTIERYDDLLRDVPPLVLKHLVSRERVID